MTWYGYVHINGQVIVKRYLGDVGDLVECRSSPFVQSIILPFEASSRAAAVAHVNELIRRQNA